LDPEGKAFLQMHKRAVSVCSSRQSAHRLPWQTQASEVHDMLNKREWKPRRIGRSQHRKAVVNSDGFPAFTAKFRPASAVSRLQTGNVHSRNVLRSKLNRPQSAGFNAIGKRRNLAVHPALLLRSQSPTPLERYSDVDDFVKEDEDDSFEVDEGTSFHVEQSESTIPFEMIVSPLSLSASIPQ
jgi:hypothetical protein